MEKNTYRPHEFAELPGVSVNTLRRWDSENILTAHRTPTNMRYYTYDQYLWFKGNEGAEDTRQTVIYSRVSSRGQKDDLLNRDRFVRFGFSWFEQLCQKFDTEIIVVNNETLSPEEELVSDIVSILHVFSCRLYGLRKYKKMIREDEDIVKML